MKALKIIGGLIGVIVAYLTLIIFTPLLKTRIQVPKGDRGFEGNCKNRETFEVTVNNIPIEGWFYKAPGTHTAPCIILSHGFAGTKSGLLEKYALEFIKEGFNVILYDFRYFGGSGGQPRQLYCQDYQVEDLKAIIDYGKNRPENTDLILWGTSAGAQLGLMVAGDDDSIKGIIGQCGAYDSDEDSKYQIKQVGLSHFLCLFMHGQRDKGRSRVGLSPHMITAYGKPGTTAMFNIPGVFENVQELLSGSETFRNEIAARSLLMPHKGDPLISAKTLKCKVLIQTCTEDELLSPKSHTKLLEILGDQASHIEYPIGHFDIYKEGNFERAIGDQIQFIKNITKK